MEEIGVKLQKAVLIMMSIVSMLGMSSCENRLDSPCPSTGEGKAVEVSLCVGIADEVDAASLAGGTSGTKAGRALVPAPVSMCGCNPLPRPRLP